MTMNNPERAITALTGLVSGLFLAVQAMAKSHPDPEALLIALGDAGEAGLAELETTGVQDEAIENYHHVFDGLQKS